MCRWWSKINKIIKVEAKGEGLVSENLAILNRVIKRAFIKGGKENFKKNSELAGVERNINKHRLTKKIYNNKVKKEKNEYNSKVNQSVEKGVCIQPEEVVKTDMNNIVKVEGVLGSKNVGVSKRIEIKGWDIKRNYKKFLKSKQEEIEERSKMNLALVENKQISRETYLRREKRIKREGKKVREEMETIKERGYKAQMKQQGVKEQIIKNITIIRDLKETKKNNKYAWENNKISNNEYIRKEKVLNKKINKLRNEIKEIKKENKEMKLSGEIEKGGDNNNVMKEEGNKSVMWEGVKIRIKDGVVEKYTNSKEKVERIVIDSIRLRSITIKESINEWEEKLGVIIIKESIKTLGAMIVYKKKWKRVGLWSYILESYMREENLVYNWDSERVNEDNEKWEKRDSINKLQEITQKAFVLLKISNVRYYQFLGWKKVNSDRAEILIPRTKIEIRDGLIIGDKSEMWAWSTHPGVLFKVRDMEGETQRIWVQFTHTPARGKEENFKKIESAKDKNGKEIYMNNKIITIKPMDESEFKNNMKELKKQGLMEYKVIDVEKYSKEKFIDEVGEEVKKQGFTIIDTEYENFDKWINLEEVIKEYGIN